LCGNHAGNVKGIGLKYGSKVTACGMTFILTLINMFNGYFKHTQKSNIDYTELFVELS